MKSNKLVIAVVVLLVIVAGAFAGFKYLEHRVVATLQRQIDASDKVSAGSVQFNLAEQKLVLTDCRLERPTAAGESEVQTVKRLEAILPWSLILSSSNEGTVLVAERVEIEESVVTQGNNTFTMGRESSDGFYTDLALVEKVLSDPSATLEWADLYDHTRVDKAVIESIALTVPEAQLQLGKAEIQDMKGLKIGSMRLSDLEVRLRQEDSDAVDQSVLKLDAFSMQNVDIPANALRMALEMEDKQLESPEVLQSLVQNLFGGQAPLFSRMEMQGLSVSEAVFPLTMKSLELEWPSNKPMRHSSVVTGLSIPVAYLENNYGISLPLLENVEIDTQTTVAVDDTGKLVEHDIYVLKDLADIDVNATLILEQENLQLMPMTIWDSSNLESAQFVGFDVSIKDKGLLSYIVWNVEGPEATGASLLQQVSMIGGSDPDATSAMIENLSSFIRHPGTLDIHFAPKEPMPLLSMMQILFDPASLLQVSSIPGSVSLEDQMKKLREDAAAAGTK